MDKYGLEGHFVEIDGLETFFVEKGQGEPLILLHGLDSSLFAWRYNIDMLSNRFHVLALDLPGFGLSEDLPEYKSPLSDYTEFIEKFFKMANIVRASLIGHSFGGTLCMHFCRKNEALVDKMILSSAPDPSMMLIEDKKLNNLLMFMYYNKSLVTQELAEIIKLTPPSISAIQMACGIVKESKISQELDDVKLSVPCYVIWGKNDALFPPEIAWKTEEHFTNSSTIFFKNCGHAPHEEKYIEFNKVVLNFLCRKKPAMATY